MSKESPEKAQSAPVAAGGKLSGSLNQPIQAAIPFSGPEGTRANDADPAVQRTLAQVALGDKDWNVRKAAVERLILQGVLAQIARSDRDSDIRKLAVSLLKDQSALSRVARTDKDWSVRLSAVNQLVDKGALAQVALKDKDPDIRIRAVTRLTELAARPEAGHSGTDILPFGKEGDTPTGTGDSQPSVQPVDVRFRR
jgi:HEAT repeat protein